MIVYCAFRAESSQSPIVIKTEDKDYGLSVDEAKALIYNLEDAVACAEAGVHPEMPLRQVTPHLRA